MKGYYFVQNLGFFLAKDDGGSGGEGRPGSGNTAAVPGRAADRSRTAAVDSGGLESGGSGVVVRRRKRKRTTEEGKEAKNLLYPKTIAALSAH